MDWFGKVKEITHVKKADVDPGDEEHWKLKIKGEGKHSMTLVFDENPEEAYPLGFPVQVKISVTQTKLVTAPA